jgi:transcription elongation factor SPT6
MSDLEEEGLVREGADEDMNDEEGEGDSLGRSDDSDDEEEDGDEQITAEDLRFIADDDEDDDKVGVEEEDVGDQVELSKKKKRKKAMVEDLSDDDLELIQENIGQKKKLKRRDYDIQNLMEQEFEQQSDDMGDFIIRDDSDEDGPIARESQNLAVDLGISDAQWRDIDELFGTGDDYPHALSLGMVDDGEESTKKKEITIKDVYEPSEIQAKMLTEKDDFERS